METSSTMKYLIGASRTKFAILEGLFRKVKVNESGVVIHVDAHALMYRLYRPNDLQALYAVNPHIAVKDLVVSFINVLAHYRRFVATRLHRTNDVLVYFNRRLPTYQGSLFPEYQEKLYTKYDPAHPDYGPLTKIVDEAIRFMRGLIPYFEGIYYLDNDRIDDYAAMTSMIQSEKYRDAFHIIFSRNLICSQLVADNVVQLVGKRDNSYLITKETCYSNGILRERNTLASDRMMPGMLPLIWTTAGCADIGMKATAFTRGVVSTIKLLKPLVEDGRVYVGMSIDSYLRELAREIPEHGAELRLSMTKLTNRHKLLDLNLAAKALSSDQLARMAANCYDLFDQNSLESINMLLAGIGGDPDLLELGNLNLATVEDNTEGRYFLE